MANYVSNLQPGISSFRIPDIVGYLEIHTSNIGLVKIIPDIYAGENETKRD